MTWVSLAVSLLLCAAWWGWFAWDQHVRYGPVIVGNARWRRELPRRQAEWEAREVERELQAALTDADRLWLQGMGWKP